MQKYLSFKELTEYCKKCVICNKDMPIIFDGYFKYIRMTFPMSLNGNILSGSNKEKTISIDIDSNKIISGELLIDNMIRSTLFIKKSCKTCDFKLTFACYMKLDNLRIDSQRLHFMMKNNKSCRITIHPDDSYSHCYIDIDGKYLNDLKDLPLDLSTIKDFNSLKKKLETIILFR